MVNIYLCGHTNSSKGDGSFLNKLSCYYLFFVTCIILQVNNTLSYVMATAYPTVGSVILI